MRYWPFKECQQTYNQAFYSFQRENRQICIVFISRQDWLENVAEKQAANFYFKFLSGTNLSHYTLLRIN